MFRRLFNSLAVIGWVTFMVDQTPLKDIFQKFSFDSNIHESPDEENPTNSKVTIDYSRYDDETNAYFKEVALKSEFSDRVKTEPRRWTKDVKIFMHGEVSDLFTEELTKIVGELNDLIEPIELYQVYNKSDANCTIFLGTREEFISEYNDRISEKSKELLKRNWGFFIMSIDESLIFINTEDTYGNELAQRHLLREELTQSLGLCNDSHQYPESIFYQPWSLTTEYAEIDKRLIDMLYN